MQPVYLPVQFFDAHRVTFVEQPPPTLSAWEQGEVDRIWQETTARNPAVFDGPLVGSLGVDLPMSCQLVASWARMTYRHRALRQLRPPEHVPGAVFVTVLLPTESGLAIGRGSSTTATPGRWSLPGGSAEPPPAGHALELEGLRQHAVRELAEELGIHMSEEELRLWTITRGRRFGSLGFHFLAPPVSSAFVRRRHGDLAACESDHGIGPELDEVAFVSSSTEATRLGPGADYLPHVLDRYPPA